MSTCQLKVTDALVWSSVKWGERSAGGWGLFSMYSKYIWLDVEEETAASSNYIGFNFKAFRGYIFMMSTKNDQFFDLLYPPSTKKWTIDQLLFLKKFANTWQILRHPSPLFHVKVINVWSVTCLLWYEFIFWFRKNYHPAVWAKQANHKYIT